MPDVHWARALWAVMQATINIEKRIILRMAKGSLFRFWHGFGHLSGRQRLLGFDHGICRQFRFKKRTLFLEKKNEFHKSTANFSNRRFHFPCR